MPPVQNNSVVPKKQASKVWRYLGDNLDGAIAKCLLCTYNPTKGDAHKSSLVSTTVRGEMARLGRTEVRFPEKLKCQTMNGKQNCADIMSTNYHHLCCKPFRSTIIVYYRANSP